jgi:hypothetical protein
VDRAVVVPSHLDDRAELDAYFDRHFPAAFVTMRSESWLNPEGRSEWGAFDSDIDADAPRLNAMAPRGLSIADRRLTSNSCEQSVEGDIEGGQVKRQALDIHDSFNVAGVHGGHPAVKTSPLRRQLDEYVSSVVLAVKPGHESGTGESPDDPVTGAVRDKQPLGKFAHADWLRMALDLMQHVVLIERVTATRSKIGVHLCR